MPQSAPDSSRTLRQSAARSWRRATAPFRLLPEFVIIGCQRGGTTALYEYLTAHPDVGESARKEVHFFDGKYHKGLNWYRVFFPTQAYAQAMQARTGRRYITGEGSPYYLVHPEVPARIQESLPNAKLIALLRNPVDRALSHYHLEKRQGLQTRPFEELVREELERLEDPRGMGDPLDLENGPYRRRHSYLARGLYADQLERWHARFPREQLLVLASEEFYSDTQAVMERIMRWIGLPVIHGTTYDKRNAGEYSRMDPALRVRLDQFFAPHNERLFRVLGRRLPWEAPAPLDKTLPARELAGTR